MKKMTLWLWIATGLVIASLVMFGVVIMKYHWDFTKLNTDSFENNTYEITEDFKNLSLDTDTADLTFALSPDGKCRVECYEEEKAKHSVSVEEDTLVIKVMDKKSWYDYIGIHFGTPKITVYLPKTEYALLSINEETGDVKLSKEFKFGKAEISLSTGDVDFYASASELVKIKTSTGKICVENISVGTLELSTSTGRVVVSDVLCVGDARIHVSTGKTKLKNVECKNLTSKGNTGEISLNHVIASEKISITRSTGDVTFDTSDGKEIYVETDTGEVEGSLLTDKVFITETSTGRIDVPKSTTGGKCEVTTSTGDIKLEVLS